jgi:hypothetical protein
MAVTENKCHFNHWNFIKFRLTQSTKPIFVLGMSFKGIIIIIVVLFGNLPLNAQLDSLIKSHRNNKISIDQIEGKWLTENSDSGYVEILINSHDISIKKIQIGVSFFNFPIHGDSVSSTGFAPCWPPYEGILEFIDSKHLKLLYYQYYWKKPAIFLLWRE